MRILKIFLLLFIALLYFTIAGVGIFAVTLLILKIAKHLLKTKQMTDFWEIIPRKGCMEIGQWLTIRGLLHVYHYRRSMHHLTTSDQKLRLMASFKKQLNDLFDILETKQEYCANTHSLVIRYIEQAEKVGLITIKRKLGDYKDIKKSVRSKLFLESIIYQGIGIFCKNLIFKRKRAIKKFYKIYFIKN